MLIPSMSTRFGSRAHSALGEFRNVVGDQRETGAAAGRKRRTAPALCIGDTVQPAEEVAREIGRLLQPLAIELEAGMHIQPERRLRAAERPGLIELDRLVGGLQNTDGGTPNPSCGASFKAFIRGSSTFM
jgi:hypothetical protein